MFSSLFLHVFCISIFVTHLSLAMEEKEDKEDNEFKSMFTDSGVSDHIDSFIKFETISELDLMCMETKEQFLWIQKCILPNLTEKDVESYFKKNENFLEDNQYFSLLNLIKVHLKSLNNFIDGFNKNEDGMWGGKNPYNENYDVLNNAYVQVTDSEADNMPYLQFMYPRYKKMFWEQCEDQKTSLPMLIDDFVFKLSDFSLEFSNTILHQIPSKSETESLYRESMKYTVSPETRRILKKMAQILAWKMLGK